MKRFIADQHMLFEATSPADGGRAHMSPKSYDSFRILSDSQVAHLDPTGSGSETITHARQNGRITFMFCSFEGTIDGGG